MLNSMKNTCSNTAHRVTDLRRRILSVFVGLIVDRRFNTMRLRSPRDNKESVRSCPVLFQPLNLMIPYLQVSEYVN